ncbi:MAG: ATP-dependent Clp protease adapter ClpS [Verrucomicrobiota bacterium]|nr:ATP-dependent Clp protease adapter ClpS [Verrucomicrobiota bacterium]
MAPTAHPEIEQDTKEKDLRDHGYVVICWDDPVNLMEYVTKVLQKVFGWTKEKAEHHMLEVHKKGKSVLVRDSMEKAEYFVHQLQRYSLHATMEKG